MGTPPCPQGGSRPCRRGSREAELGPPTGIRAATLSSRPLQPARDRTSVAGPRRRREHGALQPPQLSPAGSRRGFELGAPTGIRPADPNSPPTGIRAADPTSPPTAIRAADLNWPPTGTRAATLSSRPLQPARDRGSVAGPRKRRERGAPPSDRRCSPAGIRAAKTRSAPNPQRSRAQDITPSAGSAAGGNKRLTTGP